MDRGAITREIVAGKFEVQRRVGAGGMAQVFLARRVERNADSATATLEDYVVLKMILPALAGDRRMVDMFLDEARVVAMLSHPNIVRVVDIGSAGGAPFIAMEYLHGQNLRRVAVMGKRRHNQIPLDVAIDIVARAAEGLHHAHTRDDPSGQPLRIVHRDVTPHNIVITYDGRIKIIDFGIAKAASQRREATRVGELRGKLRYLAPEQVLTSVVDARTDVFALGVILFELTTLHRAFGQSTEEAVLMAVATADIPRPSAIDPAYPKVLEDVVMKAIAANPADRFQSADELVVALDDAADALQIARASQVRMSNYVRSLFAREMERSVVSAARPDQRTAVRANPWARPEQLEEPSTELATHIETDPVDEETAFEAEEEDTELGWAWLGEDPRDEAGTVMPVDSRDVEPISSDSAGTAAVSQSSGTPGITEPTFTAARNTRGTGDGGARRRAPLLIAAAIAVVGIVTVGAVAASLSASGGDEVARADVPKAGADTAPATAASGVEDAGASAGATATSTATSTATVSANASAIATAPVTASAATIGEPDASAKGDGGKSDKRRHARAAPGALPPLAEDASPATATAWLDANCRSRVACAADVVARKGQLNRAKLDVVRAFPDALAQCVRQCKARR